MSLEPLGKVQTGSDSCSCQARSISLLERLVSKAASRENRIDVLLADVRNSIATLAIFMACTRCASRDEQNMLLAMAARQISIICAQMANCFKSLQQSGAEAPQTQADLDASIGPVDIFVSTYRVSRRERLHMLKSLVTLQTIELQQHLDAIKARCGPAGQVFVTEAEKQVTTAQTAIRSTSS
jgi:hypothetical protein